LIPRNHATTEGISWFWSEFDAERIPVQPIAALEGPYIDETLEWVTKKTLNMGPSKHVDPKYPLRTGIT